jgi:hypothetical protein
MSPLPRGDRLPMDNLQSSLVAGNTRKTCPSPIPPCLRGHAELNSGDDTLDMPLSRVVVH